MLVWLVLSVVVNIVLVSVCSVCFLNLEEYMTDYEYYRDKWFSAVGQQTEYFEKGKAYQQEQDRLNKLRKKAKRKK